MLKPFLSFSSALILSALSTPMAMENTNPCGFPIEKVENAHRMALYTGAFDPLHNGHDEVMDVAIREYNLDFILISPDPDRNNYKPYLSNRHIRHRMLEKVYGNHPKIIPCFLTQEVVDDIRKVNSTVDFFGIVGSDNILLKLSEQRPFHNLLGDPRVSTYLVHVRDGDNVNISEASAFFKKDVAPLTIVKYPNLSSTKIRTSIFDARDRQLNIKTLDLPIPYPVLHFISEFNPYGNIPNPPHKFTLQEVKSVLGEAMGCDLSLITPFQRGLSGDLIYLIPKGDKKVIAKVFVGMNRDTELVDTKDISLILNALELTSITFVKPEGFLKKEAFNVAFFPFIEGKTILECLVLGGEMDDVAKIIGRALAEFNIKKPLVFTKQGEAKICSYYNKLMGYIDAQKDTVSYESLSSQVTDLYERFKKDPGCMGYNHGDCSPTNIIMTDDGILHFIDYTGCAKTLDQDKNPIGFPAHDLHQFLSAIEFHLHLKKVAYNKDYIFQFSRTLKTAYLVVAMPFISQASLDFFDVYYSVRSRAAH